MKKLSHKFVEFVPDTLSPDEIYVSFRFSLVTHLCACGCNQEIVTPLSPKDWQLIYNGNTISLYPSIGNWKLSCRSHYWIQEDSIVWASDSWLTRKNDVFTTHPMEEEQKFPTSETEKLWAKLKRPWAWLDKG